MWKMSLRPFVRQALEIDFVDGALLLEFNNEHVRAYHYFGESESMRGMKAPL